MSAGAGAIRAGLAVVSLGADLGPLQEGLDRAAGLLRGYATEVAKVGAMAAAAGAAIAGPLSGAFKSAVGQAADVGSLAAQLGLSADQASRLQYAMGGGEEGAQKALMMYRRLSREIAAVAEGNKEAADNFAKLGIDVDALKADTAVGQIMTVGAAIDSLADNYRRGEQAQKYLGKGGIEDLKKFANAGQGLREKMALAGDLGLVVSEEQVQAAREVKKAWGIMKDAVSGVVLEIGRSLFGLSSGIKEQAAAVLAVAKAVRGWITENRELVLVAFRAGMALSAVGAGLVAVAAVGPTALAAVGAAAGVLGSAWAGLGSILVAPFALLKTAAIASASAIYIAFAPLATAKALLAGVAAAVALVANPVFLLKAALVGLAAWWVTSSASGEQFVAALGEALGGIVKLLRGDVRGGLADLQSAGAKAWSALQAGAVEVGQAIGDLWGRLRSGLSGIGSGEGILSKVLLGAGGALTATTMLNPVLAPIAAIQAATAGLTYAFFTQTEVGQRWGQAIGTAATNAAGAVRDELGRVFGIVGSEGATAWGTFKDTAVGAFSGIASALRRGDWESAAQIAVASLKVVFYQAVYSLQNIWEDVTRPAREKFREVVSHVTDMVDDIRAVFQPVIDDFVDGWNDALASVRDFKDQVVGFFSNLSDEWKQFLAILGGPITLAVGAITSALDVLKPYCSTLLDGLEDNWGSVFGRIAVLIKTLLSDALASVVGKVADMMRRIADTRAAKLSGQSGRLGELADSLAATKDDLDSYSEAVKKKQELDEEARRKKRAAEKAERALREAEERGARDEHLAGLRADRDAKRAAEAEAAAKAKEAAEAAAHEKKMMNFGQWLADNIDVGPKIGPVVAAAREVRGTTGASLTGSAGYMQALGLGKVNAVEEYAKKVDESNKWLQQINEQLSNLEGPTFG